MEPRRYLLLRSLDVVGEPGLPSISNVFTEKEQELTRPSKMPVPSVATLGATYHSLSFSLESCSALVTSSGLKSALKSVSQIVSSQVVRRTAGNVLLVCKHQQESVLHFAIIDDLVQF